MSSAGTVTPVPRRGETRPPQRVLLLSESEGMAAVLGRLLERDDRLTWLGSLREVAEWDEPAGVDAVVVDVPRQRRRATLEHLRRRYRGPVVVLVERGADPGELPSDEARELVARPFAVDDLRAALGLLPLEERRRTGFRPPAPAGALATPAATAPAALAGKDDALVAPPVGSGEAADLFGPVDGGPAAAAFDIKAIARPVPARPGGWPARMRHVGSGRRRVELLLTELAHGWRTRRWVRVAGFLAVCVLAFTIAFVVAVQGRCGPGCDDLGTGVAPSPTHPLDLPGAPAAVGRAPGSTAGPEATPGSGEFRGAPGGVLGSTTSTTGRAATTTRRTASGGGTAPRPTPTTADPGVTTTTTNPNTTTTTDPNATTTTSGP